MRLGIDSWGALGPGWAQVGLGGVKGEDCTDN
jgi:hypothetical protein